MPEYLILHNANNQEVRRYTYQNLIAVNITDNTMTFYTDDGMQYSHVKTLKSFLSQIPQEDMFLQIGRAWAINVEQVHSLRIVNDKNNRTLFIEINAKTTLTIKYPASYHKTIRSLIRTKRE